MRKKHLFLTLMGAIALTGTVGFTSCADNNVAEETNPNYNAEKGEVLVDFAFNVSTNSKSTRMSATAVQENTGFRGIEKALLLTYKQSSDGSYITSSTPTNDKSFDLDQLIASDGLNPSPSGSPKSRRVLEMSLPTGTNTLLFWGKAKKSSSVSNYNADENEGSITFSPNENLAEASFTLTPCLNTTEKANLLLYEQVIAAVLNKIVQAEVTITNLTFGDKTIESKTLKWSDYVDFTSVTTGVAPNEKTVIKLTPKDADPSTYVSETNKSPMSALGLKIANLFATLNTFGDSELRNGEGRMIELLVSDIYNVMNEVKLASPTTIEEKAAQEVAKKMLSVIGTFFGVSTTESVATCTWKEVDNTFLEYAGLTPANYSAIVSAGDLGEFPDGIFRLPPGATILTYTALDANSTLKNEYNYMSTVPTYAMGSGDSFNPFNYMYPAELCYFGNSPIRVTDDTHVVSDYPDGATNWDNDDNWKTTYTDGHNTVDWTKNGHVLSSTRSVAMQDNINYGTALLQTTIRYKDNITQLQDNNQGLHPDESANLIDIYDGDNNIKDILKLTGVLIGGQAQTVGWNYIPVWEGNDPIANNPFTTMVYDNQLPSSAIPTPSGKENYTLVWDNWNETQKGEKQNVVYVALQFQNNTGRDFWGRNNVIRSGSTFYIIGKLDPDAGQNTITWPTKYALPPYDEATGQGVKEHRIFIQDYKTTANFVIDENSLKSALVSVPDLRSSQITLGLSVDLTWSQGLEFDNVVVGGTE